MDRILLLITPDKSANLIAWAIAALAFLIAILELVTRDYGPASYYMHMALLVFAFLMLLSFFSTRATFNILEDANARLNAYVQATSEAEALLAKAAKGAVEGEEPIDVEAIKAQRKENWDHLLRLVAELKGIEARLDPKSPMRPKYEHTISQMELQLRRRH